MFFIYETETNVNHNKVQEDVILRNAGSREIAFLQEDHTHSLSYTNNIIWAEQFLICIFRSRHTRSHECREHKGGVGGGIRRRDEVIILSKKRIIIKPKKKGNILGIQAWTQYC